MSISAIDRIALEDWTPEDDDPEAPINEDFFSDPAYWEEYYRDDKGTPDYYETWPGDGQVDDYEAYGVYAEQDGC